MPVKMGTVIRPLVLDALVPDTESGQHWVFFPFHFSIAPTVHFLWTEGKRDPKSSTFLKGHVSPQPNHVQHIPRDEVIGRLVPFQLVSKTQSETKPTQVAWQGGAWAMSKTVTPRFPPDPTRLSSQTGGQVTPNISTGHQPTNANSQPPQTFAGYIRTC